MADRYLSVKEYATFVGLHPGSVYRWIALGVWPDRFSRPHRLGRTIRVQLLPVEPRVNVSTYRFASSLTH